MGMIEEREQPSLGLGCCPLDAKPRLGLGCRRPRAKRRLLLGESRNHGFTLFEIMLVIVLVALLAATVAPRIASVSRVGVQSSVRRYGGLVRYAYDNAVLTGRVHRIILDLDNQTWHVEEAEPGALPLDKAREEQIAKENEGKSDEEKRKSSSSGFKKVGRNLIEKVPNGVQLLSVESWRIGSGVVAKQGEIAIYAYPSGFIDESTVTLSQIGKEEVQNFRVTTKSLTGRISIEVVNSGKREATK